MIKTCKRCGKPREMMSWEDTCFSCLKEADLERTQEAIRAGEDPDTTSSDFVICPHCGEAIDAGIIGYADFPEAYTEGDHEIECPGCGKHYTLSTTCSYSWETKKTGE